MIISVWNNKGGQGKTTISMSLAFALVKKFGKGNIVLIDSDSQANITDSVKVKSTYQCDLFEQLNSDRFRLRPNHTDWGFDLITGDYQLKDLNRGNESRRKTLIKRIQEMFATLNEMYAITIIDCSPSLDGDTLRSVLNFSDRFILPVVLAGRKEIAGVKNSFRFLSDLKIQLDMASILFNRHGASVISPRVRRQIEEMGYKCFNNIISDALLYIPICEERGVPPGIDPTGDGLTYVRNVELLIDEILTVWSVKIPKMKYLGRGDWN